MRRTGFNRSLAAPQEPTINVTPLIDVVFVLLISFMVVAPLLELDRVELASSDPQARHMSIRFDDASPIQIHVHENNTISCNGRLVCMQELQRALYDLKGRYPEARVQLFHHKRAHFGTYQAVKDSLESAQFKEMDVVLLPS